MCSLHNNIVSDIRLAKETGYQGLEIHTQKLWRYINAGFSSLDFKSHLEKANILPSAIDIVGSVEATDKATQQKVFKSVETLCLFAKEIGAPTIQLNAFEALNGLSVEDNINITAQNIKHIADIGQEHGIRFNTRGQPGHRLQHSMIIIDCMMQWVVIILLLYLIPGFFWACRGATLEDVAK